MIVMARAMTMTMTMTMIMIMAVMMGVIVAVRCAHGARLTVRTPGRQWPPPTTGRKKEEAPGARGKSAGGFQCPIWVNPL